MDAILDEEAEEIGNRFRDDRRANDQHLKARFEEIFRKYERDFSGVGDEIDLLTGDIIIDNGHLQSMQHEIDTGDNTTSFIDDLTLQTAPESEDATPDLEDDSDFDDALGSLGREIDELSDAPAEESGVASEFEQEPFATANHHVVEDLGAEARVSDAIVHQPASESQWRFPELPKDDRIDSASAAEVSTDFTRDRPKASPLRSRSIWAPDRRPGRPRTRELEDAAWQSEDSDVEDIPINLNKLPPDLLSLHASMGRVPAFQQIYAANTARRLAPRKPVPDLRSAGSAQHHFSDALRPHSNSAGQHAIVRQSLKSMQTSHLTQLAYQHYMLQHQKAAAQAPQRRKLYTKQEDELIIDLHYRKGLPWVQIRDRYLPERSLESLINRWTYLRRHVIGDLLVNGDLDPEHEAEPKQTIDKVNGFKLSASYRVNALRASLLAKNDDNASLADEGDDHDVVDAAVEQISSNQFTAQDDAKIKKLRDEDKLLFAEIAKQLPHHDEGTITDRYYTHLLSRPLSDILKAAAKARSVDTRQYLQHKRLSILSPPPVTFVQQDPEQLPTILPALGLLPSTTPPPTEPQRGPASFVVNHKLLKRTRRRKKIVNGECVFVDSKRVQAAFAGTEGSSLPKWALAANTRHESPAPPSEDDSLAGVEPARHDHPALQSGALHEPPARQLPSSIPDTEEELLLSSNPEDLRAAKVKPSIQVRRSLATTTNAHLVGKAQHVPRQPRLATTGPVSRPYSMSELQCQEYASGQVETQAWPEMPVALEEAYIHDEPASTAPELGERHQRATTPYGQLWDDLDSSPVFEPTFYGTPARWKAQSAPYFVNEVGVSTTRCHATMLSQAMPMIDPRLESTPSPPLQLPMQTQPSTTKIVATHLPAKRKSLETPHGTSALKTSLGSPVRKRPRANKSPLRADERVNNDDKDNMPEISAITVSQQSSNQHERRPEPQIEALIQPESSSIEAGLQQRPDGAEHDGKDFPLEGADRATSPDDRTHQPQSRPRPRLPGRAGRTSMRHKGRLSELKRALSDRRHSVPLSKTTARPLNTATARRMSALARELSDDELA